jgi:hypothetical protein
MSVSLSATPTSRAACLEDGRSNVPHVLGLFSGSGAQHTETIEDLPPATRRPANASKEEGSAERTAAVERQVKRTLIQDTTTPQATHSTSGNTNNADRVVSQQDQHGQCWEVPLSGHAGGCTPTWAEKDLLTPNPVENSASPSSKCASPSHALVIACTLCHPCHTIISTLVCRVVPRRPQCCNETPHNIALLAHSEVCTDSGTAIAAFL